MSRQSIFRGRGEQEDRLQIPAFSTECRYSPMRYAIEHQVALCRMAMRRHLHGLTAGILPLKPVKNFLRDRNTFLADISTIGTLCPLGSRVRRLSCLDHVGKMQILAERTQNILNPASITIRRVIVTHDQ